MRLLLDTNVLLWILSSQRDKFTPEVINELEADDNSLFVSSVSVWEIAIKRSLGKLAIDDNWFPAIEALSVEHFPIQRDHARRVESLPWLHRDPFDRLLIAQAQVENLTLVTADERILRYDLPCLATRTRPASK